MLNQIIWSQIEEWGGREKRRVKTACAENRKICTAEMGERMGKAERIEIEDFVQNIVERMETPEAFEKMISREEECEAQGQESRLRDVLKKEWPVDEKGERIYQITNIYEEKAEELLIVELYTGIHLENGVPCGHFTLYLCGEPDGWKLSETRMMEYLQNL